MKWPSLRPHYSGNLTKLQAEVFKQQSSLDCPRQHVPHRLRRLTLDGTGDVGVGVQGETRGEVAQHPRHRFHVHPILQCQGGKGVTKLVEATNGHSLVEAENAICYDIVRDYGLRRSLFCERGISSHGTKKQKTSVHGNG